MPTFEIVKTARDQLLAAVKLDPNYTNWFRGAGMGFTADDRWQLVVYVKDEDNIPNVEMLIRGIGYTGPYKLEAIGDIRAL